MALCFLFDQKGSYLLRIIIAIIFTFFLYLIQAKTSLLILCILILIHVGLHIKRRLRYIFFLFSFIIFIIFSFFTAKYYLDCRKRMDTLTQRERFFVLSVNTRLIHWDCGWEIFSANPITGVGIGNLKSIVNDCYLTKHANVYQFVENFNIHNEFLEEGVRHGMIGVLVYFICFFFFFRNAIISGDKRYLQFLIIVVLASVTETTFSREQGVVMIVFFNTFFYVRNIYKHQRDNSLERINVASSATS